MKLTRDMRIIMRVQLELEELEQHGLVVCATRTTGKLSEQYPDCLETKATELELSMALDAILGNTPKETKETIQYFLDVLRNGDIKSLIEADQKGVQ